MADINRTQLLVVPTAILVAKDSVNIWYILFLLAMPCPLPEGFERHYESHYTSFMLPGLPFVSM